MALDLSVLPLPKGDTAHPYRLALKFSGQCQGVGFRYTAQTYARRCAVTGWVRNEYGGIVDMEAQGTPRQIRRFLKLLDHAYERFPFRFYIASAEELMPVADDEPFKIRY